MTSTPRQRPFVGLSCLLLVMAAAGGLAPWVGVHAQPDAQQASEPEDETTLVAATGAWDDGTAARLRLVHNEGFVLVAIIGSEAGPNATCVEGDGRLTGPGDQGAEARCSIHGAGSSNASDEAQEDGSAIATGHTEWTVVFDGIASASFEREDASVWQHQERTAAPSWNLTGLIVLIVAIAAVGAVVLMTVLWARERRFRDFLARRLYEETRGRVPDHWPEGRHNEKQLFARYVARGKN